MQRMVVRGLVAMLAGLGQTPVIRAAADQPVQRLLYVANDVSGSIEIFAIAAHHAPVRTIPFGGSRFRGLSAHPDSARLYVSDSDSNSVAAIDLRSDAIVWRRTYSGDDACITPDRLNVTLDGSDVYVPCKDSNRLLILNAATGDVRANVAIADNPHNTFTGESGHYMYVSARSGTTLYLFDPGSRAVAGRIGGFSSPIRPFSVNAQETRVYANLTNLLGFAVADIPAQHRLKEAKQVTPSVRTDHPSANGGRPHGDHPFSHGIAVRPGTDEVWFSDDAWGYFYVYQTTGDHLRHLADVALWRDVTKPWGHEHFRWVTFDIEGQHCYAADGTIIAAETRQVLWNERIPASEKLIEIDFEGGAPVAASGQNGGVYYKHE